MGFDEMAIRRNGNQPKWELDTGVISQNDTNGQPKWDQPKWILAETGLVTKWLDPLDYCAQNSNGT